MIETYYDRVTGMTSAYALQRDGTNDDEILAFMKRDLPKFNIQDLPALLPVGYWVVQYIAHTNVMSDRIFDINYRKALQAIERTQAMSETYIFIPTGSAVEAMQYNGANAEKMMEFVKAKNWSRGEHHSISYVAKDGTLMQIDPSDWAVERTNHFTIVTDESFQEYYRKRDTTPKAMALQEAIDTTSDVIAAVRDQLSTMYQVLDAKAIKALERLCELGREVLVD